MDKAACSGRRKKGRPGNYFNQTYCLSLPSKTPVLEKVTEEKPGKNPDAGLEDEIPVFEWLCSILHRTTNGISSINSPKCLEF
jgi:hypothetical protein